MKHMDAHFAAQLGIADLSQLKDPAKASKRYDLGLFCFFHVPDFVLLFFLTLFLLVIVSRCPHLPRPAGGRSCLRS